MFGYTIEYYYENGLAGLYIIDRECNENELEEIAQYGYEEYPKAKSHKIKEHVTAADFHGSWKAAQNWTGVKGKWVG